MPLTHTLNFPLIPPCSEQLWLHEPQSETSVKRSDSQPLSGFGFEVSSQFPKFAVHDGAQDDPLQVVAIAFMAEHVRPHAPQLAASPVLSWTSQPVPTCWSQFP